MSIRLKTIECWKCNNPFDYTAQKPDDHIYSVYCPFCESENVVDLNPFRKDEDIVFRGGIEPETKTQSKLTDEYDLPEKLQGTKPE